MNKQSMRRCVVLCALLAVCLTGLSARLVYLQVVDRKVYSAKAGKSYERVYPMLAKRGAIVDCNGEVIVKSVISKTMMVDKYHLREPRTICRGIACRDLMRTPEWYQWDEKTRARKIKARSRKLLQLNKGQEWYINEHLNYACKVLARPLGMTPEKLKELIAIDAKPYDKAIVKNLDPELAYRLKELIAEKHIKGFRFDETMKRSYNSANMLTHTIGITGKLKNDLVEKGRSGIEYAYDEYLAGKNGYRKEMRDRSGEVMPAYHGSILPPINGDNVELTIDMGIQAIVEEQLDYLVREYNPVRATIIVMNPQNGDILGIASRPHFNLEKRKNVVKNGFNYALQGEYEPGSTFKVVSVSAALNEGIKGYNDRVFCHNGYYREGKVRVRDDHPKGYLKVWQILQKSNNIGTYMLAKQLGYKRYMRYVKAFGFGSKAGVGVGSEGAGLVRHNGNMPDFATMTYGYALRVTPMQIANLYCTIANGGKLMRPRIVKRIDNYLGETVEEFPPKVIRRVLSERAARNVRRALETVVQKGGTATRADIEGYTEGGKTGTAEKWDNKLKHYSKTKRVVSFVGMLPIKHPQFVCLVLVDEPRIKKDYRFYGGTVAAPVWRETMKKIAAYRNLTPTEEVKPQIGMIK